MKRGLELKIYKKKQERIKIKRLSNRRKLTIWEITKEITKVKTLLNDEKEKNIEIENY